VSPDDLAAVDRSWAELDDRRGQLAARLEASFARTDPTALAARRALWLVDAVAELVGLLTAPSRLGERARRLTRAWPLPGQAPTFAIEGRAWMRAAREVCPTWSPQTEQAWHRAWVLLSDVLAEEALSPFAGQLPVDVNGANVNR
jgi:hypothetical protein